MHDHDKEGLGQRRSQGRRDSNISSPPPLIRFGTHCCGNDCPSVTATRAWLRASGPVSQKAFIPFLFSNEIRIGESDGIKLGVSVAVAEVTWEIVGATVSGDIGTGGAVDIGATEFLLFIFCICRVGRV